MNQTRVEPPPGKMQNSLVPTLENDFHPLKSSKPLTTTELKEETYRFFRATTGRLPMLLVRRVTPTGSTSTVVLRTGALFRIAAMFVAPPSIL